VTKIIKAPGSFCTTHGSLPVSCDPLTHNKILYILSSKLQYNIYSKKWISSRWGLYTQFTIMTVIKQNSVTNVAILYPYAPYSLITIAPKLTTQHLRVKGHVVSWGVTGQCSDESRG